LRTVTTGHKVRRRMISPSVVPARVHNIICAAALG
jgi:hypothetical protein